MYLTFHLYNQVDLDKHRRDIHYEKINTICQYCDKVFEGSLPPAVKLYQTCQLNHQFDNLCSLIYNI